MHARVLVVLAMRNLRRQLRRTLLTASAMIIGGGLLIFSLSFGDGSHEQWIDSGVRLGTGHVTVERPEFRLRRRIDDRLPAEVRRAVEEAFASPEIAPYVVATSSKLSINGLASSAAGARPAQIMAVDPVQESAFGMLDERVVEGRYLEPDDRLAAFVGAEMVESLELRLGSRLRRAGAGRRGRDCGPVAPRRRHLQQRRAGGRPCADAHSAGHRRRVARLAGGRHQRRGPAGRQRRHRRASPTGWSACWPTRSRAARRG